MFNKSKVLFKGKGSGLTVVLDENVSYDDLKIELLDKIKKSKTFFQGATEDIQFEGKQLTSEQENEIAEIINRSGLEIGFINSGADASFALKKSINENQLIMHEEAEYDGFFEDANGNFNPDMTQALESEEKVLIYNGFVRSGTLVESDGNIVIMGGVNHGGEVFAGGNIIVFGQLKGKAVAGRNGDEDSFIAAILMEPELLGISNFVTRFPDSKKEQLHKSPSIARLKSNKIIISPVGNINVTK